MLYSKETTRFFHSWSLLVAGDDTRSAKRFHCAQGSPDSTSADLGNLGGEAWRNEATKSVADSITKALLNNSQEGIVLWDAKSGCIVDCNAAFAALLSKDISSFKNPTVDDFGLEFTHHTHSNLLAELKNDTKTQRVVDIRVGGTGDGGVTRRLRVSLVEKESSLCLGFLLEPEETRRDIIEQAMRASKDGAWSYDCGKDEAYFSPRWKEILGYAEDEISTHIDEWRSRIHPDDFDRVMDANNSCISVGKDHFEVEYRMRHKDGSYTWVLGRGMCIRKENGNPARFVGVHTDITKRKRAEEKLARKEEHFRYLYQKTPAFLHSIDKDGYITHVSDFWLEKLGYTREEVVGKKSIEFITPESRSTAAINIPKMRREGFVRDVHYQFVAKDGSLFDMLLSAVVDTSAAERNFPSLAVMQDVTERLKTEKTLAESEEQYRNLFISAPVGIFESTPEGKLLNANPALARMYGFSNLQEMLEAVQDIGMDLYADPNDRRSLLQLLKAHGEIYNFSSKQKKKDGSSIRIRGDYSALFDTDGNITSIKGFLTDTTSHWMAEERLKKSERNLKAIIDNCFEAVTIAVDGKLVFGNPSLETLVGAPLHEIIGSDMTEFIHPDDREMVMTNYGKRIAGLEAPLMYDFRALSRDGTSRWVMMAAAKLEWQGRPASLAILSDITQRKSAERELKEREAHLQSIFRAIPVGVGVSHNRFLQKINNKLCDMLGCSCDELSGMNTRHFYLNDIDYIQAGEHIREVLATGGIVHFETRLMRRDGKIIDVEMNFTPLDVEDPSKGITFAALDITDRKQYERELKDAKETAESANKAKSEFLANMSHEIRTPLNGIQGMLQLLETTDLKPEQEEYTRTAVVSCKRLTALLGDILDLSRIEAGKLVVREEPFNVIEVLDSVYDLLRLPADEKGIKLLFNIHEDVPKYVVGDATRLQQVLFNLIGNAVKFTEAGSVSLDVRRIAEPEYSKTALHFTITDTGIGIPEGMLDHVFETFVQAEGSYARKHEGAGLGLPLVKRLLGLMGGTMSIESNINKGTTVSFTLPLRLQKEKHADDEDFASGTRGQWSGCRILLAEDDAVNQKTIARYLEKAGCMVHVVENGEKAVEAVQDKEFDLILMDIRMPVMDGVEAAKRIRSFLHSSSKPRVPILALTAYAMQGDRETFLKHGMDEYIAKPLNFSALEDVLKGYLNASPNG